MTINKQLRIVFSLIILLNLIFINTSINSEIKANKTIKVDQRADLIEYKQQLAYPFHLIDDLDRKITFDKEPQRIISIAPSATEVVYSVGAGDKLVAVDFYSNYPKEAEKLQNVTTYPSLDIETIILYNPDLIFGAGITSLKDINALENQGFKVFILAPLNVEDVLKNIEMVGNITNHEEEARDLKNYLQERIDSVKEEANTYTLKPKVYIEFSHDPLYTYGNNTYGHDLIELAGALNIAENTTGYPEISNEFVITQNPDIMFYAKGPWTTTNISMINSRLGWNSTNAVKNGHVYSIDENIISRGGPRIVDALEQIHLKTKLVAPNKKTSNNIVYAFEWYNIFALISIIAIGGLKRRFLFEKK